jgi:hypothetical protein
MVNAEKENTMLNVEQLKRIHIGSRVRVFDSLLFVDDIKTPLSFTMRNGTVVKRYGIAKSSLGYRYNDLVDVLFDHRTDVSHGHFTNMIELLWG